MLIAISPILLLNKYHLLISILPICQKLITNEKNILFFEVIYNIVVIVINSIYIYN